MKTSMDETLKIFTIYLEELIPKGKENKVILNLIFKFLSSHSEKEAIENYRKFYEKINKYRKDLFHEELDTFAELLANNENSVHSKIINIEFVNLLVSRLKDSIKKISFSDFYFYFQSLYFFGDSCQYFTDEKVEKNLFSIRSFEKSKNTINGIIELRKKNNESGLNLLTTALYEDSEKLPALIELGDYYFYNKNFNIADSYYQQIFEQFTNNQHLQPLKAGIYFNQSYCAIKLKEYNRGIKLLNESLKIDDTNFEAYNNLAYVLKEIGRFQESLELIDKGLLIDSKNEILYFNKVDILKKSGNYKEAINVLNHVKEFSKARKRIQKEIESIKKWQTNKYHLKKPILSEIEEDYEENQNLTLDLNKKDKNVGEISQGSITKERFLEDLIEHRIEKGKETFGRYLKIHKGDYFGRQYPIPNGRIDLLCEDIKTKDLIVVELKKEVSDSKVIDQTTRYIDFVKKNIAKNKIKVRGIICLNEPSESLIIDARKIPDLEIHKYSFHFEQVK